MKKISVLMLTLCLMLLCACTQPCAEHSYGQWTLEGEDYIRVCEVCKEKEVHIHTYGDWEFGLTDMSHSCVECGTAESLDIVPELAIKTHLPGHWFFSHSRGDTVVYAYHLNDSDIGFYLDINEDGSAVCWNMETLLSGTWSLKEYDSETGYYYFTVNLTDGTEQTFLFDLAKQNVVFPLGDDTVYLTQATDLIPYVVGIYAATEESGFHRFTLEENHTITEYPDSSWHVTPIYSNAYLMEDVIVHSYHFDLKLFFREGDQTTVRKLTINLCPNDYGLSADEINAQNRSYLYKIAFNFNLGDGTHLYQHVTADELALLQDAQSDYPEVLAGTWTSTKTEPMGGGESTVCTEYSISFTADGKFNADLGQKLSGTWKMDSATALGDAAFFSLDLNCSNGKAMYGILDTVSQSLVISDDGKNLYFTPLTESDQS